MTFEKGSFCFQKELLCLYAYTYDLKKQSSYADRINRKKDDDAVAVAAVAAAAAATATCVAPP